MIMGRNLSPAVRFDPYIIELLLNWHVIPAEAKRNAGISLCFQDDIPACAGMSVEKQQL